MKAERADGSILETERLFLREMGAEDRGSLAKMMQDPQVMYAYEGAFSDAEVDGWLERQCLRYEKDGFGLWAVCLKETEEMIGQCGVTLQDWEERRVHEIGYLFQRAYWRKGFAAEAAKGCKGYAFDTMKLDAVYSIIRDTNLPSMNVAIRNGMLLRGRMIKHFRGVLMPHLVFGVSRTEVEADR
ncbi:GNAT family N-acetyltransferase [Oscillospiraceae bacterium OttesenSCG-928-F05]|nr:GNAT family N-acetyltransferase [Oscillospiraceae bacterium OttesenSCG-928-F05]